MNPIIPALLLTLAATAFPAQAAVEQLPKSCIPKRVMNVKVTRSSPLVIVKYKDSDYHLLVLGSSRKEEELRAVIRRSNAGDRSCYLSYVDVGEGGSLSYGVPIPVAKAFALVAFKNTVKNRGGKEAYEQWFRKQKFAMLTPEDANALKTLGVRIPGTTKVLPWVKRQHKEEKIGK
jgi:hypothetical protein